MLVKTTIKKMACLAFSAMMVTSLALSGCADQPGNSTSQTPQNSQSSVESKKEEPSVPINWYFPGNGQPADADLVASKISEYVKGKGLNIDLKLNCFDYGSYVEKVKNMAAAGEEFDICFTASWGLNYKEMANNGAYVDITEMFDQYAPKTKAQLGDVFLDASKIKGRNYAVPTLKEKAQQYGFMFLKKYVDQYKLDLSTVKKPEDLEPILKTIKEKEPTIYPMGGGWSATLKQYFDDLGAPGLGVLRHDSNDYKVVLQLEEPEYKAYYELAHKFYNAGYIRKDAATVTDQSGDEKSGKLFSKCSSLKPGKDKEYSNSTGQEWIQIETTPAIITNGDTMGSMNAISITSKNPEKALAFLEFVNTDETVNNLMSYGVKDVHYTSVSSNLIKKTADNTKYCPGTNYMFGNVFLNYLWDNEDPKKWEAFEAFNTNAIPAKSLGFDFDPSKVKNEIAACDAVKGDYEKALENGTVNPNEYLPKYLKALKDAGVDRVIAEKQTQLDAWVAQNK